MTNNQQQKIFVALGLTVALIALAVSTASGQRSNDDYDDEGYGPQGSGQSSDADSYGGGYANDDNYVNSPSYQQGNDADAASNSQGGHANQPASDADDDYNSNDDSSAAAASEPQPSVVERTKRSVPDASVVASAASDATGQQAEEASDAKLRVKRSKHYIGPVYTYVKTDKHANFKWGVKHKVGKKHHG